MSSGKREWAVITGASSGIGLELAKCFATDGVNLVLAARDKAALESLATELRKMYFISVKVYDGDLSKQLVVKGLYDMCVRAKLPITYLVNSAGIGDYANIIDADWQRLKNMMNLNMLSVVQLTQAFARDMAAVGKGKILNIASIAGFLSGPRMATYYASKAFVLHFSEAIAAELVSSGVTVTVLCPGPTSSNFALTALALDSQAFKGKLPSAEAVARYGYAAMKKGRRVVVHGTFNRLALIGARLVPREVLTEYIGKKY